MRYTVTRTIQAVGQGAFYTEIFERPNDEGGNSTLCVVYDCGSATRLEPKRTIESALFDDDGKRVGLIQIPHHGSAHNSSINAFVLCEDAQPLLFVSYGCNNRYGHPSTRLLGKLRANGYEIAEVTEKKDSYYMEIIKIL